MAANEDTIGHSAGYWKRQAVKAREVLAEAIALMDEQEELIEKLETELAKLKAAQNA